VVGECVETDDNVENDKGVRIVNSMGSIEKSSEPVTEKLSRQQRKVGRTRAKLLAAARSVFSRKGLDLTTIDEITEQADVGRGTFYYHFSAKEDLISELIGEMLDQLVAEVNSRCAGATNLSELLEALIGAHVDFFSTRWEDFVLFYQGRADLQLVNSYDGIETPFLDYLNSIERLVDSVLTSPISRPAARRLACAIAGFISGYYSFAVIASEKDDDVDKSFHSLRSAFVASLVRFINEALPDTGTRRH